MATFDTFIVNGDLRTISIPPSCNGLLGVESDEKVAQIPFRIPRYYGDLDLTTFEPRVNYLNANGEIGVTICSFSESNDEYAYFTWTVDRRATRYKGTARFVVCLILTGEDGLIEREFNTTVQTLKVLEGIEAENEIENEYTDIINYILNRLDAAELATTYTIELEDGVLSLVGDDGSRSSVDLPESLNELYRVSVDESDDTIITAEATSEKAQNIVPGEMVNLQFLDDTGAVSAASALTFNVSYHDPSEDVTTVHTYHLYNQRQQAIPAIPAGTIFSAVCTGTDDLYMVSVAEGSDVADLRATVTNHTDRLNTVSSSINLLGQRINANTSNINVLQTKIPSISSYSSAATAWTKRVSKDSNNNSFIELMGTYTIPNTSFGTVTLSTGLTLYAASVTIPIQAAGFASTPSCVMASYMEYGGTSRPGFVKVDSATPTQVIACAFSFSKPTYDVPINFYIAGGVNSAQN